MSDQIDDKTLARIQKLLAMANDARGNENEAANAATMAQDIAARYGLELAQIEALAPAQHTPGGKREKTTHNRAAMYRYQQTLMAAVASAHFCKHMITQVYAESFGKMRKVKRHVLLGRDVHVKSSLMVYDYLVETMDRLCPWQGTDLRGKSALLWMEGCSDRLADRLQTKRADMERASEDKRREDAARARHPSAAPSGNALVLADVYSTEEDYNTDFENGWPMGTTAARKAQAKAERLAREAAREAEAAILRAQGVAEDIIALIGYGYSHSQAVVVAANRAREAAAWEAKQAEPKKPETEAQRRKREEREERQRRNDDERSARANAKYYTPEYQRGVRTGDSIGLDAQVGHTAKKEIG